MATHTGYLNTFETLVAAEQATLLRFCTHLTGSSQAAEDLIQETLLTAWRRRETITDFAGLSHWLKAIARNICRNWQRSQQRQNQHLLLSESYNRDGEQTDFDIPDELDLDIELERSELMTLLDRAMGLLPPETRGLLIQHYIEELPQPELAAQVGLSTGAVAVRLHRGKLALRQVLTTEFQEDAVAYGLVSASDAGWVETRIWCFQCGQHRLQARFKREEDHLCLCCPGCCNLLADAGDTLTDSCIVGLGKFKAFKPAFTHVQKSVYATYFEQQQVGVSTCYQCGESVPIRAGSPPGIPHDDNGIYVVCDRCQDGTMDSWNSLALCLPQVRQFWRDHPRIRKLSERRVEIDNSPAILTGFASVTDNARIEVAFSLHTFEVLYVD